MSNRAKYSIAFDVLWNNPNPNEPSPHRLSPKKAAYAVYEKIKSEEKEKLRQKDLLIKAQYEIIDRLEFMNGSKHNEFMSNDYKAAKQDIKNIKWQLRWGIYEENQTSRLFKL